VNCWKVTELSDGDLRTIRDLGFRGIRFDVQNAIDVEPSCEKLLEFDLEGLVLINGGSMPLSYDETVDLADRAAGLAAGTIVFEIGNEPDISPTYERDWDGFGVLVNAAAKVIAARFPVVSGGLFSTEARGLEYLAYAMRWMDPGIAIGIHSYRQNGTPQRPHFPWRSRDGEMLMVKALASPRPVWVTEMGWHTAPFPVGLFGWRAKYWTDEQVLRFLAQELHLQKQHGTDVTVVYQWTDGPTEEGIDRFGLIRTDGSLKPQAQCVKISDV
jgi:hypothetical protein